MHRLAMYSPLRHGQEEKPGEGCDTGSSGAFSVRPSDIHVYTAAIFLSAALLFAIQPMFTKMVLPRLYSGTHFV